MEATGSAAAAPKAVERRVSRRYSMSLPVLIRFAPQEGSLQRQGATRDVSFRGLYFVVDAMPEPDTAFEFVLTLPKEMTMGGDFHIRGYARVVRVEPDGVAFGVAASIDRYEIVNSPA